MTLHRTRWTWVASFACLSLALTTTAWASPRTMKRDRSDNSQYFQWNAESGEIELATSSRRFQRRDNVDFTAFVSQTKDPGPGRRLTLRVSLALLADHAVRYDGEFRVMISSRNGPENYSWTDEGVVTLRDSKHNRRAAWSSRFDLPSGEYDVFVKFRRA